MASSSAPRHLTSSTTSNTPGSAVTVALQPITAPLVAPTALSLATLGKQFGGDPGCTGEMLSAACCRAQRPHSAVGSELFSRCHPERRVCFAKRSTHAVEGPYSRNCTRGAGFFEILSPPSNVLHSVTLIGGLRRRSRFAARSGYYAQSL